MVSIRKATIEDLIKMQSTNLICLPENYSFKYYIYHYLSWNPLLYCAEDTNGNVIGYVLAKLEEDDENSNIIHGHITSISILRTYRRLGIATKLMKQTLHMMKEYYNANFCSLHVRASNQPAFNMYNKVLGFEVVGLELGYYADGEDAYNMKYFFNEEDKGKGKDKIIKLTDDVEWKDIMNKLEEVDGNGEEKDDREKGKEEGNDEEKEKKKRRRKK